MLFPLLSYCKRTLLVLIPVVMKELCSAVLASLQRSLFSPLGNSFSVSEKSQFLRTVWPRTWPNLSVVFLSLKACFFLLKKKKKKKSSVKTNKGLIVETGDLAELHINEVLFWKLHCLSRRWKNKCEVFNVHRWIDSFDCHFRFSSRYGEGSSGDWNSNCLTAVSNLWCTERARIIN